jgi:hypothetical protein
VLVVKIDGLDPEPFEASVAGGAHILGTAIDAATGAAVLADDAELGGDDDLFAKRAQSLADQELVGTRTVDIGGVEESDAEFNRPVDRRDGFGLVARPIKLGHAHASETHFRYNQSLRAEFALLHAASPCAGRDA